MAFRLDAAGIGPRVTAIFVALFLMTLVSAGCGSGELGDMAAIFESPPEVVDVTAHSARVHAVTNIDVVCSVAYGETREYGRLATDSDMDASGHEDHGPLLTGLKPNTEYHLTFGGIGPDGTVYRYSDMTFRTKPAPVGAPAKPSGQDLALLANGARVVGTSSNFGGAGNSETWGGNQAIDGDASTQWSSDGDGNDAWIEIELAAETRVTGLGFWSRTMGSSAEVHAFRGGIGRRRGQRTFSPGRRVNGALFRDRPDGDPPSLRGHRIERRQHRRRRDRGLRHAGPVDLAALEGAWVRGLVPSPRRGRG